MGTAFSQEQISSLISAISRHSFSDGNASSIDKNELRTKVVLLLDSDAAGQRAIERFCLKVWSQQ
jgi:DNA primase